MIDIHPTAIIDPKAKISDEVKIGPYTVIGKNVSIKKGTVIYSHVFITGKTSIGQNNTIYPFTTLGTPPQDQSYAGEEHRLEIGDNNIFRAKTHINMGSTKGGGLTRIGNNNYFMESAHVGHDSTVENNIVLTNSVALGGHSLVEDFANLSFAVGLHQFTRIGAYSMIGGGAQIIQDVPPFAMAVGARPTIIAGVNVIGMRRIGFSAEDIANMRKIFRLLFWKNLRTGDALKAIESSFELKDHIVHLLDFIKNSPRGIIKKIRS